jgi:spectinomycin phosphotransferase
MLLPDPDIDVAALEELVAAEFGAAGTPLVFAPGGGDSWSYRAGELWVSVRRDRQGHRPASYHAVRELADRGCSFVLAPLRGRSGRVVLDDGRGRPVLVFPFVEHRVVRAADTEALRGVVAALHAASVTTALEPERFDLYFDDELDDALAQARVGPVDAGPYGRRVETLLRENAHRIAGMREEIAECRRACRAFGEDGFVLTHGEPDGNVIATGDGRLMLVDCGDLRWGPPERDLLRLRDAGADVGGRPVVFRFYELLWVLGEIAEYAWRFTHAHAGDAADDDKWAELLLYLPGTTGTP